MTSLTDRYVYATLRSVPEKKRDDIGAELRASIEDMIEARRDAGDSTQDAERAILTELGEPGRLASEYSGTSLQLIGPRYFLVWKRLNLNLLAWVPATVGAIVGVVQLLDESDLGDGIGAVISAVFTTAFQILFWTTLTFAILERVDVEDGIEGWTVDKLPQIPGERSVSLGDAAGSAAFIVVMMVALVGQHFRSWVEGANGDDVPVLNPDLWSGWLPLLLVALAASLFVEVWKYRVGRWTWPIALATIFASAAFALPVAWLAHRDELFNPDYLSVVEGLNGTWIVLGALAVLAWEVGEAVFMTWRGPAGSASRLAAGFKSDERVR